MRTGVDNEGVEAVLKAEETQRWEMTFHWSRGLYEFYVSRLGGEGEGEGEGVQGPLVLDADDILKREIMERYARLVGLDPGCVRYEWDLASDEELRGLSREERRMRDTLLGSRGIVEGKTAEGLVLEVEVGKWRVEFGEVLAARLEGFVRESMPDYEWLWERRLVL